MDTQVSFGGLIPIWILGAPIVLVLIASMMGPKTRSHHESETRAGYPAAPDVR